MKLKTKLVLSFLAVALVPLGVGTYVLVDRLSDSFEADFDQRMEGITEGVRARLKSMSTQLVGALEHVASDPICKDDLLEPLSRGRFYDDSSLAVEGLIVSEARRLVASAAFDTLRIVDLVRDGGHVIALGHRTGYEPPDHDVAELVEKQPGSTFFRFERVENYKTGKADEVWTLQVAITREQGKAKVAFVGGKIIGQTLLADLRVVGPHGTQIVLEDKSGRRIAATFEGAEPPAVVGGYTSGERWMGDPEKSERVALLRVFVPRGELVEKTEALVTEAAILAGAATLFALLAGLWLARRLSKPLEALATAAAEIAAGARTTVKVPRGKDEVAKLTTAFNQMSLDLVASEEKLRQSERVAAWREIARRIAHEIKNPLSPIQMSIETLKKVWERRHPDFETIFQESTATILEEVQRMKRIVTEFSDFARMPAPRPHPTELVELATSVVGFVKDTAPPDTRLTVVGVAPITARVDPDQLRQAVLNLAKNALEALAAKPLAGGADVRTLEVRVEPDGPERVRLVVTDNGPGMSPETRARLFTPYFTTKSQGTGLGLAIVQRIVGEHEGTIRVDSELGVGTRFVIRLPVAGPRTNPRSTNPPV